MKILDKMTGLLFKRVTKTVFWRIDNRERLILFGHGAIPAYGPGDGLYRSVPWRRKRFRQVVIGKGITYIHPTALLGINLDDVILEKEDIRADGLEINEAGLYDRLKKELLIGRDQKCIKIPEGTLKIHKFAFAFHQLIEEIICASSLKEIDDSAFEGARRLKLIAGVPKDVTYGKRVFHGTHSISIDDHGNPSKRELWRMYAYEAITDHGRGFLMNGTFTFFATENDINIDPTKFYACKDLISIAGGKKFMVGLREDGTLIYELATPFLRERYSCLKKLKDWKKIRKIVAAGKAVAGLCEDGTVFCTESQTEDQRIRNIRDASDLKVRDGRIYVERLDYAEIQIAGEEEYEEDLLYF